MPILFHPSIPFRWTKDFISGGAPPFEDLEKMTLDLTQKINKFLKRLLLTINPNYSFMCFPISGLLSFLMEEMFFLIALRLGIGLDIPLAQDFGMPRPLAL